PIGVEPQPFHELLVDLRRKTGGASVVETRLPIGRCAQSLEPVAPFGLPPVGQPCFPLRSVDQSPGVDHHARTSNSSSAAVNSAAIRPTSMISSASAITPMSRLPPLRREVILRKRPDPMMGTG